MQKNSEHITQWIRNSAKATMRVKQVTRRPFELSDETKAKMEEKKQQRIDGNTVEELKPIRKAVSKSVRKDRRHHQAKFVDTGLDIRDQYMEHVPFAERADASAEFLHTKIWERQTIPDQEK